MENKADQLPEIESTNCQIYFMSEMDLFFRVILGDGDNIPFLNWYL